MNFSVTCSNLFDGEEFIGPRRLEVQESVVVAVDTHAGPADFPILAPGLVDIQMNGFEQWDVAELDSSTGRLLDDRLGSLGTTTWLGTIVTAPLDTLESALARLSALKGAEAIPGCAGAHMEGPFLGGAPGAHNPKWIVPFDEPWLARNAPLLRLVTLAAEQPGAPAIVRALTDRGVSVSIGHSRPSRSQYDDLVSEGASLVTHLFNGMSGIHHRDGGLALWALNDRRVRAGLIADLVHVGSEAITLAFHAKDSDGVCLVSDSVAWMNPRATSRGVRIVDGAPRLPDGTIAGSSTPLITGVRNVVTRCGVDQARALRAATSSPARSVGLTDRGVIAVGGRADIIALDDGLHLLQTWRRLPSGRDN